MQTATVEDVQARLPAILETLRPGEEVVITREGKPVAKLVSDFPWGVPIPGRAKGMLVINAEDDEHLKDFAEYME
jgi:antitoxin (DNA-binding transcriptional repressor) of toxin-antitoxin stability system